MTPQPHIAIFLPTLHFGGVERVMTNLASGFAAKGFTVDLVAADARGQLRQHVPATVRVVDLASTRVLMSLKGLVRYLRNERPQALIAAMSHSSVIALCARKLAGVPTRIIATEHTSISKILRNSKRLRERLLPACVRLCGKGFDEIVAVSEGVAEDFANWGHLPRGKVKVIYNPVLRNDAVASFSEPVNHTWLEPDAPPVILGVGRLAQQKGFDVLMRAFALVREQQVAKLMILGEGQERSKLEDLARELGVEQDVWLPGYIENPHPYMARSTVFVLSSNYEGFGVVLVEALAAGLPIVSTDCESGPREVLRNGQYGKLVPVGDVAAMAAAIRAKFAEARPPVPHTWLRNFEVSTVVEQYAKLVGLDSDMDNPKITLADKPLSVKAATT